ncbi:MAG: PHP domain-containing protein, partial [Anaerolineales bacterium]|nr:PHP domain-containing protein [Anaerolineales bacterium]
MSTEYSGPSEFVHLHCHTLYSTHDGVQSPEQLFNMCAERNWPAVAITEHGRLNSVPDCYFASKASGVQYIPGCEIYFNDYEPARQAMAARGEKMSGLKQSDPDLYTRIMRNRHLTVLAKNMTGFHNLVKMTTEAYQFGFYARPRVWFDKLLEYKEGLIILTGCFNGPPSYEIGRKLMKTDDERGAWDYLKKFKREFGDDLYVEVQMPCLAEHEEDIDDRLHFWTLIGMAEKLGVRTVLTNDVHYLDQADFETQKLMMAIGQNVTVDSPDLFHANSNEQYLKTRADLWHTFKTMGYDRHATDAQFEAMCDNTLLVAEKCKQFSPSLDPKIPTNDGDAEKLKRIVVSELMKRGLHKCTKKYVVD